MTYRDVYTDTYGTEPMTTFGVDYSYSRDQIDIEAMARDGVKFACRYLRDGSKAGKALLPAEAARLTKAGIKIVANDETNGTQLLGGFDGGARDAKVALAAAQACGMPPGRPIYFTPWDHDPAALTEAQWNLLRNYADGAISVLGVERVGWYGGTQMLRWLKAGGRGRWWWQSLGWRQGVWLDWAHLQQYDNGNPRWNGEVDYDRALVADYGQWAAGQGDTMSAEDVAAINKHSDDLYRLLAKPSDGRANLTDLRAAIVGVTGEIDATQSAIANLQLASVDPVALAAALSPLIGADLADKVAAELAKRLEA